MITKLEQWNKITDLRNQIIGLDKVDKVESLITSLITTFEQEEASPEDILNILEHLRTLFLTYLITEGQDHSQTNSNVIKAREILRDLENKFKTK